MRYYCLTDQVVKWRKIIFKTSKRRWNGDGTYSGKRCKSTSTIAWKNIPTTRILLTSQNLYQLYPHFPGLVPAPPNHPSSFYNCPLQGSCSHAADTRDLPHFTYTGQGEAEYGKVLFLHELRLDSLKHWTHDYVSIFMTNQSWKKLEKLKISKKSIKHTCLYGWGQQGTEPRCTVASKFFFGWLRDKEQM